MASLVDVASLAGVSTATVSRVINRRGNVHPDTVRVVEDAMSRIRYEVPANRPRSTGASDGVGGSASLSAYALVMPEIATGLYASLLGGFEAAATKSYRKVIVSNTADDVHRQGDTILQLIHKRVNGIAIVPVGLSTTPSFHIEAIQAAGIPVVLLHRPVEGVAAPVLALPIEAAAYDAGRAILDAGHRRVAMITNVSGPSTGMHLSGFERSFRERGLERDPTMTIRCTLGEIEACVARAIDGWAALPGDRRPTAVFVTHQAYAEVLYVQMLARGVRVPAEMSVVTFSGQESAGPVAGRLTRVAVDERSLGHQAVEWLDRAAADRTFATQATLRRVGHELIDGGTLAAPHES